MMAVVPTRVQKVIKKLPIRRAQTPKQKVPNARPSGKSILDFFAKQIHAQLTNPQEPQETIRDAKREPLDPIGDVNAYIEKLKHDIDAGHVDLRGNPWVIPKSSFLEAAAINSRRGNVGERSINSVEALNLVLRPQVFVWAPHRLFPGLQIPCPSCGTPGARARWWRTRTLHRLSGQAVYITTKITCCKCPADVNHKAAAKRSATCNRSERSFLADSPAVMHSLPDGIKAFWNFVDTGHILCEAPVADFVRSMSTRASWSMIADVVNEMKSTSWIRAITLEYLRLCDALGITPSSTPSTLPAPYRLHEQWVRKFFVSDFEWRQEEIFQEILAEKSDNILVFDWTTAVAVRCGEKFMFNVMNGDKKIIASAFTRTSGAHEVQPLMSDLKQRGVHPKAVYVDDECCGAWTTLLEAVWPGVAVRLDGLHAIMRLAQTTSSVRHPWHGEFCAMLSQAIYIYNQEELKRLCDARERAGLSRALPKGTKSKYIPRVITDASAIIKSIDDVINLFAGRCHEEMGALLTPETFKAWENLRKHVHAGCLCDPPGIDMNVYDERENVTISGEVFHAIRTLRGASALEGLHSHQKQWLGTLGRHALDAGFALVSEGTLRWNRRRNNEAAASAALVPMVFAGGLLQEVNTLSNRLSGNQIYPGYILNGVAAPPPITSLSNSEVPDKSERRQSSNGMSRDMTTLAEQTREAQRVRAMLHAGPNAVPREIRGSPSQLTSPGLQSIAAASSTVVNVATLPGTIIHPAVPQLAAKALAGCRQCHMVGTACRRYNRIQWCQSNDVSFNTWVKDIYPAKKVAAKEEANKKAARVGGQRGRPKIQAVATVEAARATGQRGRPKKVHSQPPKEAHLVVTREQADADEVQIETISSSSDIEADGVAEDAWIP
jgi:hypothetical protein